MQSMCRQSRARTLHLDREVVKEHLDLEAQVELERGQVENLEQQRQQRHEPRVWRLEDLALGARLQHLCSNTAKRVVISGESIAQIHSTKLTLRKRLITNSWKTLNSNLADEWNDGQQSLQCLSGLRSLEQQVLEVQVLRQQRLVLRNRHLWANELNENQSEEKTEMGNMRIEPGTPERTKPSQAPRFLSSERSGTEIRILSLSSSTLIMSYVTCYETSEVSHETDC